MDLRNSNMCQTAPNVTRVKRVFALLAAGILSLGLAPPVMAQELKLATIAPEGSAWMKAMREGAREISERTSGRVTVKFYGGGVQGNARQVQRKMRTGQLHGGVFTASEIGPLQKDAALYSLPLVFENIDEARFARTHFDEELQRRIEAAGYVTFGFAGGGFAYLMSSAPLSSLEDFSGQKLWTPEGDEISFAALKSLGIAPVVMPTTDVLTGLQTDLLDSVAVPPVAAVVFQWHTRLKYILELPIAYVYGALLIEQRAFNRISEPDRAVVREVFEAVYEGLDSQGADDNQEALEALLQSGLELVKADANEVAGWKRRVNQSHAAEASDGALDAALLNRLQDMLQDYRARDPVEGGSG